MLFRRYIMLFLQQQTRMRTSLILPVLLAASTHASVYKCQQGSQTVYQQTRCEAGSAGVASQLELANSLTGCYPSTQANAPSGYYEILRERIPRPRYRYPSRDWYRYRHDEYRAPELSDDDEADLQQPEHDIRLWLLRSARPGNIRWLLRAASRDEVTQASRLSGYDLRQGVTFAEQPRHHHSYMAPGIYRGQHADGGALYYLHFADDKGLTRKIVCR